MPEDDDRPDVDPAPEPDEEPGEDTEFHLLPNLQRLRALSPEARADLVARVKDWDGPLVTRWREAVASLGS